MNIPKCVSKKKSKSWLKDHGERPESEEVRCRKHSPGLGFRLSLDAVSLHLLSFDFLLENEINDSHFPR